MENRFLIHIDILGFEEIPKKIAKDSGLDEDTVREKFLKDPLVEKIRKQYFGSKCGTFRDG